MTRSRQKFLMDENEQLRNALHAIRDALFVSEQNCSVISGTLWMNADVYPNERVFDYINVVLGIEDGREEVEDK